jgi:hypothetical protein
LIVTLVLNAVLLAAIYFLVGRALQAANQTVLFFAIGAVITLALWLFNYLVGSRLIERAASEQAPRVVETPRPTPAERVRPQAPPVAQAPTVTAEAGAVQMLAILQRQGRLIDFLQEDLSMYDDAQIGAAVRNIHAGARQALAEHVRLEPVFSEPEGSSVTVQPGFDPRAVRLSGHVVGEPPFRGALQHRGWRVARIDLPKQAPGQDKEMILAPAEVEVNA